MTFGGAIRSGYANYFNFSGRATRPEYWWFQFWVVLLVIATALLMLMEISSQPGSASRFLEDLLILLAALLLLATMIPALSVQVRRLRDSGHSGWWVLWSFLAHGVREGWVLKSHPGLTADRVALLLDLLVLGTSIVILVFSLQRSKP